MKVNSSRIEFGFTWIELIFVVAGCAILLLLLAPATAHTRDSSVGIRCINNLRQMASAANLYSADNRGCLAPNYPVPCDLPMWCAGNAASSGQAGSFCYGGTNIDGLKKGVLWRYIQNPDVYRCPADLRTQGGLPILRSISMNCWMNGRSYGDPLGSSQDPSNDSSLYFRIFRKESDFVNPSRHFVFLDESEYLVNDCMFVVDMGLGNGLLDVPANRHQDGYSISFADAHVEVYKLKDAQVMDADGPLLGYKGADWQTITNVTTVPR